MAGVVAERIGAPATMSGMVLITLGGLRIVALRVPALLALDADGIRARHQRELVGGDLIPHRPRRAPAVRTAATGVPTALCVVPAP